MVKGISRQVIVVHSPDPKLFEQAIFILKEEAVEKGITEEALLKEAQSLIRRDPDYFFTMLPYALALGVEKPFAKSFRGKQFPPCSYLSTGDYDRMTALEWALLTGQIAGALDAQHRRLFLEKLFVK